MNYLYDFVDNFGIFIINSVFFFEECFLIDNFGVLFGDLLNRFVLSVFSVKLLLLLFFFDVEFFLFLLFDVEVLEDFYDFNLFIEYEIFL